MQNRLLAITRRIIPYVKELRNYAKTPTACLLMQQLEYWFNQYPEGFYKFTEPSPTNKAYRPGDSWAEELNFSAEEVNAAFQNIGVRYTSKTSYVEAGGSFEGKFYASYYDRQLNVCFYFRNHTYVDSVLDKIAERPDVVNAPKTRPFPSQNPVNHESRFPVNHESRFTETMNPGLPQTEIPGLLIYTESTKNPESTTEKNTAVSSLSSSGSSLDRIASMYASNDIENRFEVFWNAYPRKADKSNARKIFLRLKVNETLLAEILSAIEVQKKSRQWSDNAGIAIPYPSTWLNNRRWEDEQIDAEQLPKFSANRESATGGGGLRNNAEAIRERARRRNGG